MIKNLQGLRFIFALMIFLHHFSGSIGKQEGVFAMFGACAVSFFFILSGFVLSYAYYDKVCKPQFEYKRFVLKRILKIYPIHLLCLVISLVPHILAHNWHQVKIAIPSFFLLQSWFPSREVYFAGNALSWYLSDIFFFYLAFLFIARITCRFSRNINTTLIFMLMVCYLTILLALPQHRLHFVLYINPLTRIIDFIVGIIAYKFFLEYRNKIGSHSHKNILEFFCISLIVISIIVSCYVEERFIYLLMYIIPMFLTVVCFASIEMGGAISTALQSSLMQKLGAFSFEIYMIHIIVLRYCLLFMNNHGISNILFQFSFSLAITLLIAILIKKYFEAPISNFIKQII